MPSSSLSISDRRTQKLASKASMPTSASSQNNRQLPIKDRSEDDLSVGSGGDQLSGLNLNDFGRSKTNETIENNILSVSSNPPVMDKVVSLQRTKTMQVTSSQGDLYGHQQDTAEVKSS